MFGSSANFEDSSDDKAHLTLVFSPDPLLAAEWQKWFDVKVAQGRPAERRTNQNPGARSAGGYGGGCSKVAGV